MAATIFVEQESGSCRGRRHPHNGYYAGDFGTARQPAPAAWQALLPPFDDGPGSAVSA